MKSKLIEDIIFSRKGDWEFDKHVSMIFDTHVRKSIPCYDEVQELIGSISKKLLSNNALVYDLGTATGEIIYNIHYANPTKNISYVGIDKSVPMLYKAKQKCEKIKNITFYNEEIETFDFKPADLIIAAFTLQFTQVTHRQHILQKIKDALKPNGNFILCEKIIYEDPIRNNFYVDIYEGWKQNYFSIEEIKAKKKSLKNVMQPITLEENIELLKTAKFKDINLFFKWCNFICILAK
ncbi:MAG: methyltransferase domain-containing protein [Gillisia sp.]|nr:methyltransferase domain-containing protein [Gillisia sp.]